MLINPLHHAFFKKKYYVLWQSDCVKMEEFYSVSKDINSYAEKHTTAPSDLLKRLERETYLKQIHPRMVAGHLQGQILSMISYMILPNNVLEIGTFTGYSAICLAKGLRDSGQLHTIEINEELESVAQNFFDQCPHKDQIHLHIGDAVEIIPTLDMKFDLVFIDAKKVASATYFDLVIDKVNIGGFILTDNVLWSGKVLEERKDKETESLIAFNKKVQEDDRVENVLLPVRDGLLLARKIR